MVSQSKNDLEKEEKKVSPEKEENTSDETKSSKNSSTQNPAYFLSYSDNPGIPLVAATLHGDDYRTWARSLRTALRTKTKLGFTDRTIKKPSTQAADFIQWDKTDSMVLAWILNSVDPKLLASISHATTVKEIWEDLEERFAQTNAPRVHKLWRTLCLLQQESDMSIKDFYTQFKIYVDELSEHHPLPECSRGASKALVKREEESFAHLFLGGLNSERFAHIKATIINTNPLPSLRTTFNHVSREESRFLAEKERNGKTETAASFYSNNNKPRNREGPKPKCDHCGKIGHIKSKCFELFGYPPNWDMYRTQRNTNKSGQNSANLAYADDK